MAALGGSCSALFVFSTIALSVPTKTKKHVLESPFNKKLKKKIRDKVRCCVKVKKRRKKKREKKKREKKKEKKLKI
jgi:hypothetical protein